ncbi:MAG: transcription antitermination protein NusB [Phormidesmis sp. RL_2_1]|nr:transcription antitermination protein NusB [Phormidesmis sp. RL_2_1]
MKARSIARELALLGISQLTDNTDRVRAAPPQASPQALSTKQLDALLVKALKALGSDAQATLDTASGDLQRGERLLLESETRTVETSEVRSRIQPAVPLIESAINQVGSTLEVLLFAQQGDKQAMMAARNQLEAAATSLEAGDRLLLENEQKVASIDDARQQIQLAIDTVRSALTSLQTFLEPTNLRDLISQSDIRSYACDLLHHWIMHWQAVDAQLNEAMEKWNMRRLARVDRDILRLAMMEIIYVGVPTKVAIDEAIEMAKRYSDEDGYRFINGVLRRVTDKLEAASVGER